MGSVEPVWQLICVRCYSSAFSDRSFCLDFAKYPSMALDEGVNTYLLFSIIKMLIYSHKTNAALSRKFQYMEK